MTGRKGFKLFFLPTLPSTLSLCLIPPHHLSLVCLTGLFHLVQGISWYPCSIHYFHTYTHHCSGQIMNSNSTLRIQVLILSFPVPLQCFSEMSYRLFGLCFCFSLYRSMFQHSLMVLVSNRFHKL